MRLIATTAILLLSATLTAQRAPVRGVPLLPLGRHWTRAVAFGDAFRLVVGGSRVLVASDRRIEALSWDSSEPTWASDLAATVPPVVDDGRVWIAADEQIHALSELTGRVEWRLPMGRVTTPLTYRSGWLFVAGTDGLVRAIRAADGAIIWTSAAAPDALVLPVAVDGDRVFGVRATGRVTAWRVSDGAVLWESEAVASPDALLAAHGRLYLSAGGRLTSRLQTTGRVQWSYAMDMPIVSRLAADQRHVFVATLDNSIRAHRASNGHQVWKTHVDSRVVEGLTSDGGMVLVPYSDGVVRFLLAETGQRAGELSTSAQDARGMTQLVASGYNETLRLVRMSVSDTARTIETFRRTTIPAVAATTLTGWPVPLTPPPGRQRP